MTMTGRIEKTDDGAVTFEGDVGDVPVGAPALLGAFADSYPRLEELPGGAVLATFPTGDPENLDVREPEDVLDDPWGPRS